jgi:hypothetical protein
MRRIPQLSSFALLSTLLLLAACSQPAPEPEPEPEPVRVENASLGLAYSDLGEGWEVAENAENALKLRRTGEGGGELWIEVAPERRAGVNLYKEVNDWKAQYEAMEGGTFHGQVELGSQFGTTFSVRGRFTAEGQRWEERRILTLYPGANRTLSLIYRYPAPGDDPNSDEERLATQERTNQMFEQMGLLGAFTPAEGEGADGGGEAASTEG